MFGNVASTILLCLPKINEWEKLRYMHRNPVQRGLVLEPQQWLWSSFRHYAYGERGPILVNETRKAELRGSFIGKCVGWASPPSADCSVTVSSNEVQHILI
jgi:hypothetical protein